MPELADSPPTTHPPPAPRGRGTGGPSPWTCYCLAGAGWVLIASGLFALGAAACGSLLPHDVQYLGMTSRQLCALDACRIVHFMEHDRVAFGGAIVGVGLLYHALALGPLRAGRAWAWWVLLVSGVIGFGSFLTYLGYGYLDTAHAWATVGLLVVYVAGLAGAFEGLPGPRHVRCLRGAAARLPRGSRLAWGRAGLMAVGAGLIAAGATIMALGMTAVFVPQDLEFMGLSPADLRAINPRLVPLIAHDRAGFGGALCSAGSVVLLTAWCGLGPESRRLWRAMAAALIVAFAAAIGVHPLVGYTSFSHLAPAYVGAILFLVSIVCAKPSSLRAEPRKGVNAL